jgi:TM2 domain-containing membrane protein YozV
MRVKEETQARPATAGVPVAVSAWLVPGLGHLMLGRTRRALTFFVVVTGMFALGLYLKGELFLTWTSLFSPASRSESPPPRRQALGMV